MAPAVGARAEHRAIASAAGRIFRNVEEVLIAAKNSPVRPCGNTGIVPGEFLD
jgi:cytidine deaminase